MSDNTAAQVARLRDPRRDPKAGDVLIYGPQWQRWRIEVKEIRDGCVLAVMDGRGDCLYYPNQWREWMADAEVFMSQPNSDMVARLREIIDGEQYQESGDRAALRAGAEALGKEQSLREELAQSEFNYQAMKGYRDTLFDDAQATSNKLAEALESVEVAKAALVELKEEYEDAGTHDEVRKATYKWSLTRIDAALARLEGK